MLEFLDRAGRYKDQAPAAEDIISRLNTVIGHCVRFIDNQPPEDVATLVNIPGLYRRRYAFTDINPDIQLGVELTQKGIRRVPVQARLRFIATTADEGTYVEEYMITPGQIDVRMSVNDGVFFYLNREEIEQRLPLLKEVITNLNISDNDTDI